MNRPFLHIARDPRIIPGVHHYCDEWCERCPHTRRCLAFRCAAVYRKQKERVSGEPTFRSRGEATEFARELAAVEGTATEPAGNEASITGAGFRTGDELARTAWEYALGVSLWLVLSPEELRQLRVGSAPSSEEVVLWFHLRIHSKLVRALVARERALGTRRVPGDEANGCAKLTLASIQRSRKALLQLKTAETQVTIGPLLLLLDRLERGIDERFPAARAFVRVGLDAPAV